MSWVMNTWKSLELVSLCLDKTYGGVLAESPRHSRRWPIYLGWLMSLPAELRVTCSGWYGCLLISTALLIFRPRWAFLSLTNVINLRQKAFVICFNTIFLLLKSHQTWPLSSPVLTAMSNGCSTLDGIVFKSPCVSQLKLLPWQCQRPPAMWRQSGWSIKAPVGLEQH